MKLAPTPKPAYAPFSRQPARAERFRLWLTLQHGVPAERTGDVVTVRGLGQTALNDLVAEWQREEAREAIR